MYSFTASGGFSFGGCAATSVSVCVPYLYSEGTIVFSCDKARKKGKLEKICIKKILLNGNDYNQITIVYVDTMNRCWLEHELCDQDSAVALAIIAKQRQVTSILNSISDQCQ